jgi:hypothetical protein
VRLLCLGGRQIVGEPKSDAGSATSRFRHVCSRRYGSTSPPTPVTGRDGLLLNGALGELRQHRLAVGRLLGQLSLPDSDRLPLATPGTARARRAAEARWSAHVMHAEALDGAVDGTPQSRHAGHRHQRPQRAGHAAGARSSTPWPLVVGRPLCPSS